MILWYRLYNFKNVKNTHGGLILFVKLQTSACNFSKSPHYPHFSICRNVTKSRKASHIKYPIEQIHHSSQYISAMPRSSRSEVFY